MDIPKPPRYEKMTYARCGRFGVKIPRISLGLWHNFGGVDSYGNARKIIRKAFDSGITHFDLANNYGTPTGSAEENFGKILDKDLRNHRDELFISTKAGFFLRHGPYGNGSSRKSLLSSLDESLQKMKLDYVDIFYSHCYDPETPLDETMQALADAVRMGKTLYVGLSNYGPSQLARAAELLEQYHAPCLLFQPVYNIFNRWIEHEGVLDLLQQKGIGCISYSALAQGILSDRYRNGALPPDSRAALKHGFLKTEEVEQKRSQIEKLHTIAEHRDQSLSQMSLAWCLRQSAVTSTLIGASSEKQLEENLRALKNTHFTQEELENIDAAIA